MGRVASAAAVVASACVSFLIAGFVSNRVHSKPESRGDSQAVRERLLSRYGDGGAESTPVPSSANDIPADVLEPLFDTRRNIRALFYGGQEQWLDMLAHLDDPAFVSAGGLRCASRHGREISACFYRMTTVVQPLGNEQGSIVHARADLVDPAVGPDPTAMNHPDCSEYVACLAEASVGEVVPIPGSEVRLFALEDLVHAAQADENLFRADKVPQIIAQFRQAIAWYEANNGSAIDELKVRKLRNTVAYLEDHLNRLRGEESGP